MDIHQGYAPSKTKGGLRPRISSRQLARDWSQTLFALLGKSICVIKVDGHQFFNDITPRRHRKAWAEVVYR